MRKSPRERMLDTALRLFMRDGFHATGIDTIVREADVAKMTLYNHFPSKDALIEEVLKKRDEDWFNRIEAYVEAHGKTPRQKLLMIFDALKDWFSDEDYFGCAFINAASEYAGGEQRDRILDICSFHKTKFTDYVQRIATAANMKRPKELAEKMSLLAEGSIVLALIHNDPDVADRAKKTARELIANHAATS